MRIFILFLLTAVSTAEAKGCISVRTSAESGKIRHTVTNQCADARPVRIQCEQDASGKTKVLEEGQSESVVCEGPAKIIEKEWVGHGS